MGAWINEAWGSRPHCRGQGLKPWSAEALEAHPHCREQGLKARSAQALEARPTVKGRGLEAARLIFLLFCDQTMIFHGQIGGVGGRTCSQPGAASKGAQAATARRKFRKRKKKRISGFWAFCEPFLQKHSKTVFLKEWFAKCPKPCFFFELSPG